MMLFHFHCFVGLSILLASIFASFFFFSFPSTPTPVLLLFPRVLSVYVYVCGDGGSCTVHSYICEKPNQKILLPQQRSPKIQQERRTHEHLCEKLFFCE